ncbi:MAG: pirin family protein [Actinobacteria bacterium]|nr:pirin family protein [Actinomycetota bacterium]MCB9411705.1 pirin family protein [Actinomycetota bacterium]
MSNLETQPTESTCPAVAGQPAPPPDTLLPRQVPLGGPRAMNVRRTLPHRDIRTVGAWCFVDDYGPAAEADPPMSVPPHPHIGLQTVTWLLAGEVTHRDSTGAFAVVRPGELNLMTAGHGIAHSEYSDEAVPGLRGIQMWVALPEAHRQTTPRFAHHAELPRIQVSSRSGPDLTATVFMGEFGGVVAPAETFTPLCGVQFSATAGCEAELALRADFEYAVLALDDPLIVDGEPVPAGALRYLGWGHPTAVIGTDTAADFLLLGGEPMAEELVMWWNFVGRSHEEIAAARADWEAGSTRFGAVVDDTAVPLAAPALPNARLRARPGRRSDQGLLERGD